MFSLVVSSVVAVISINMVDSLPCQEDLIIVPREGWNARPPTLVENMTLPVPYVFIHHSYIPAACETNDQCIRAMHWMQDYHQFNHSWNDLGYNFAAGGDNRIYTGRGWTHVGAHAPKFNKNSIGICIIGDWTETLPPESQLKMVKALIEKGVNEGYIQKNYKLFGHRQVRETTCPGEALYKEIQTWPHWTADPYESETLPGIFKPDPREEDVGAELFGEHNNLRRHSSEQQKQA